MKHSWCALSSIAAMSASRLASITVIVGRNTTSDN
jgi:hypothetical protein